MMHHRIRKIRNTRRSRRLHWLNCFHRDDRGVQLLELAIVLPILLLLFGAVAEFGRYFYEYTTVAKAARVGARYLASKSVVSGTYYQAIAKNIVVYGNAAGTGSPVLPGLTTANVENAIIIDMNTPRGPKIDLGKLLKNTSVSTNVDVKPSVTMRFLLTQPSV